MKNKLVKGYLKNKLIIYFLQDDRYVGNVIASTGNYEAYETSIILNNIKKGNIVVDIGANIGFHTILFADKVGPQGKVYAFEPDPVSYEILLKNIRVNNLKNVIAKPLAISNKKILLNLYKSKTNYGDNRVYASDIFGEKLKINADSLDNLFNNFFDKSQRISLLKIDTQGFEPFIIQGAKKLIKQYKPTLFFEYWPYGYFYSKSNGTTMLNYLKKTYKDFYLIDENNEKIVKADIPFINSYCEQLNGYLHGNLFCTTNRFIKIDLSIKDTISKLKDRIHLD